MPARRTYRPRVGFFYSQEDDPVSRAGSAPRIPDDEGGSRRQPIGVPEGYSVPSSRTRSYIASHGQAGQDLDAYLNALNRDPSLARGQGARYYDGDEAIPAGNPGSIPGLQQKLARVGLLTSAFTPGFWDDASQGAFGSLLAMANQSGKSWEQVLNSMVATMDQAGPGATPLFEVDEFGNIVPAGGSGSELAPPPALITRTTDPAALKQVFRKAVIEILGVGFSGDQLEGMVSSYNQMEVQRQQQLYDAQLAAGQLAGVQPGQTPQAGSVVDIPSSEAWVEAELIRKHPQAYQTHQTLGFVNDFMQMAGATAYGVGQ